jgi:uncharacterized protein YndB with AHSA1/START domain
MKRIVICTLAIAVASSIWMCSAFSASTDPIVTEAVINAPVSVVWREWTTKEGIESWMVAKTEIDLRIGGTFRTSYSKTSNLDDDESLRHIILSFDPLKMFSMRTVKPPKNFPFQKAILNTWTVVYFEPVGESQTKVIARMLGFGEDEESQKMRSFFEAGNKTTLDSLVKKHMAK